MGTRLRCIVSAIATVQALAGSPVPLSTDWAHITHSELEKVNPTRLRAHPAVLATVTSTLSQTTKLAIRSAAKVDSANEALPKLTLDSNVIQSCVGGRVHLNVSSGPGYRRNESDWIGVYSPASADINAVVPIKVVTLGNRTQDPTGMGGPGPAGYLDGANITLAFDLVNVRGSYAFVFFSADNWWSISEWWQDHPADAVAIASAGPVILKPNAALQNQASSSSSSSASVSTSSVGADDTTSTSTACDQASLRPRVLPHVNPSTRVAVPQAWDVVWTGGAEGGSLTLYYTTSFSESKALPCAGLGGNRGCTTQATNVASFTAADLCGAPANTTGFFDPGRTRTATVTGLEGGTTLYYCMDELTAADEGPAGGLHTFTAPPGAGVTSVSAAGSTATTKTSLPGSLSTSGGTSFTNDHPTTTLAVFGDLGRGTQDASDLWHEYGSPAVGTCSLLGKEADDGTIHGVFHIGDLAYSVGYLSAWDYYLDMLSAFTSKVPYIINQGNHEYDWFGNQWQNESPEHPLPMPMFQGQDSGGECGVPTSLHVPLPLWHSTNLGAFHVVSMCTEVNFTQGSPQWLWLLDDLRSVNRSVTPWILFGGHRPMYVDSDYGPDNEVMDELILHLEPLLLAFNVSLAVWGHNHAVQRQCACAHGACVQASTPHADGGNGTVVVHVHRDPPVPVHMLVGTGGASFTKNAYGAPFNEMTVYEWGYARVSAINGSYLEWEFLNSQNGGEVLDRMAIWQDPQAIAADIARRNPFDGVGGGSSTNDDNSNDDGTSNQDDDGLIGPSSSSPSTAWMVIGGIAAGALVGLIGLFWCWWALRKRAAKMRLENHDHRHTMLLSDDGMSFNGDGALDMQQSINGNSLDTIPSSSSSSQIDVSNDSWAMSDKSVHAPHSYNADSDRDSMSSISEHAMSRIMDSPKKAASVPLYEPERSNV